MSERTPPIPTEFLQVWSILNLSYPNFCRDTNAANLQATLQLYYQLLRDVPIEQLRQAVLRHVSSCKWFPTVAELRTAATALQQIPMQSAVEAWGEVMACMAKSAYYCFEDHVREPHFANPITERLVQSLGWRTLCLSENGIADRARFLDAYDQLAARDQHERALPPQLQAGAQAVQQLVGGVALRLAQRS
jgi:hypothetical protein